MIRHAFTTAWGDQIFCIDVRTQRALFAAGDDPDRLPLPPLVARKPTGAALVAGEHSLPTGSAGLDGSLDDDGRVRRCPAGSFPKLIPPIEKYYRFPTLADIFYKTINRGYVREEFFTRTSTPRAASGERRPARASRRR